MFYACVETYSDGKASFAYVSEECPPDRNYCAGRYNTSAEAEDAAFQLRKLLKAGEAARANDRYEYEIAQKAKARQ